MFNFSINILFNQHLNFLTFFCQKFFHILTSFKNCISCSIGFETGFKPVLLFNFFVICFHLNLYLYYSIIPQIFAFIYWLKRDKIRCKKYVENLGNKSMNHLLNMTDRHSKKNKPRHSWIILVKTCFMDCCKEIRSDGSYIFYSFSNIYVTDKVGESVEVGCYALK